MSSNNYQSIIHQKIPSAFECLVSSISDMKHKGKKLGCELAAHEYEPILLSIQQDYLRLEIRLELYKDDFNKIIDPLINEYKQLQSEKKCLEEDLLSRQIPPHYIAKFLTENMFLFMPLLSPFCLTGIKQNAFVKAAEESYKETVRLYCDKITFMKEDFDTKSLDSLIESENFRIMLNQILKEIVKEKIEIARLQQLLQETDYVHPEF